MSIFDPNSGWFIVTFVVAVLLFSVPVAIIVALALERDG